MYFYTHCFLIEVNFNIKIINEKCNLNFQINNISNLFRKVKINSHFYRKKKLGPIRLHFLYLVNLNE